MARALAACLMLLSASVARADEAIRQSQPQGTLWVAGTALTAGALLTACPTQVLRPMRHQSQPMRVAIHSSALLVAPIYLMLKTAFAAAAVPVGYVFLALSFDPDLAHGVRDIGSGGDWWLTAEHVTCERPIELLGSGTRRDEIPEDSLPDVDL
jgi:hypothetical protein